MDTKDLCEHTRIRLIAAAVGHQQCTKTESNIIPIPGTDRVIAIGTPAQVRGLLADDHLARRAEPSVTAGDERIEAWLYVCKKPGEGRTYASVDENDTHHWPLDQWKSVEKIPLVRAALASPAVSQQAAPELCSACEGMMYWECARCDGTAHEPVTHQAAPAVSQKDGAADLSAAVLSAMYAAFQRGDSIERAHAAVMALINPAATTASASGCGGTGKLNEEMPCLGCDACPRETASVTSLASCAAGRDGECGHAQCPQLRDDEPRATGRHCPLDSEGGHHD